MSMTFAPSWLEGEDWDELEQLNLSNSNAWRLLGLLGIEQDYCGSIDADDLIGRIHTALAVGGADVIDTADPASKALSAALSGTDPFSGPTFIDCAPGRDELLATRGPRLLLVALEAKRLGRHVTWG